MRSSIQKLPKKAVITKGAGIVVGKGIDIQDKFPKIKDIKILDKNLSGHFFLFGTTGAGKTKFMETMIVQNIQKGNSVVCLDPKGDIELFSKIIQTAFETGREDDLCLITPIYTDYSAKVDPLYYYAMPEEIVSHVVAGIQSNEQYFIDIAYKTALMIIKALLLLKKHGHPEIHINFNAIYNECSFDAIKDLLRRVDRIKSGEAEEVKTGLQQIIGSTDEHFTKVTSSLQTVLTALSNGAIGKIIGKSKTNDFMKRLESNKKVILVVQTPSLLAGKTAHMIGRVIISMIQSFAGRKLASGDSINPPLCLFMDEFSNVAYLGIEDLFSKGRAAHVRCHAFTQSVADLEKALGPSGARVILDNTNVKVFMRVNDPTTAKYIADYSGTRKVGSPIIQTGGMITIRESEEPTILMEDAMRLREQDFYLFDMSGGYKGRSVRVKFPYVIVSYPKVFTQGN